MLSREPQVNLKITCPACPQKLDASGVAPFTHVECPSCGYTIMIPRRFGQYLLEAPLEEGDFCGVYRALDLKLDREVCIKILDRRWADDAGTVERFQATVRRTAALNHHNIVPIYSSGDFEGLPFLIMEYMDARSGNDLLDTGEPIAISKCLTMATEAVRGLEAANREEVLHGGLHPGNILLGGSDSIKVSDFGMAFLGTPADNPSPVGRLRPCYASPEALRGEDRDFRSDIFSLGAVLYHVLTRHPPFPAELSERMATLDTPPGHDPQDYRPKLPQDIALLVMKMLAPDPAERPSSYKALMGSLNRQQAHLRATVGGGMRLAAVAGRPLPAQSPEGPNVYLQKKAEELRRRKLNRDALGITILICLVALIAMFLQAARTRPAWYVDQVETRMRGALLRFGIGDQDSAPTAPAGAAPETDENGSDGGQEKDPDGPAETIARPRPGDFNFALVQDDLNRYLRAQPAERRRLERERITRLSKSRNYLQSLMRYLPYRGENGIKLASGQIIEGNITTFGNDTLTVATEGAASPVEIEWSQIAVDQYLAFFEFYIDQRLGQTASNRTAKQEQDGARDYLLLALLADWYGDTPRAKIYAEAASRLDPRLRGDVGRFLGHLRP